MKVPKKWLATGAVCAVLAVIVAAVATYSYLFVSTGSAVTTSVAIAGPTRAVVPLNPADAQPVDNAALTAELSKLGAAPAVGTLGARVVDETTGEVIFEKDPTVPLRPASSTKVLTAAAALLKLGGTDTITTEVYRGADEGTVVVKAAGDVWFTSERLQELSDEITAKMPNVARVVVDTSAWQAPPVADGWENGDVDGGYVAPMEPIMLYGARIGATEGEVPRSHTPALDVARALAADLGASEAITSEGNTVAVGEKIASSTSPDLDTRLAAMMVDSDNVMAEAIGREIDPNNPTGATLQVLAGEGFNIQGVKLLDNSGLSVHNRITPLLLDEIMANAVEEPTLRTLIGTLPVAGASGTLAERYQGLDGAGWVRAKTGTLTETSALVGVVPSQSGHIYSFAFISNGSSIMAARPALDAMATVLRDS